MASPTLRQSVTGLSDQALADLRKAITGMQALTDNRGFNYQAGIHGVNQHKCWHHNTLGDNGPTLTYPLFLPWHRAYLLQFEQAMQDIAPTSALAWWDWRTDDPNADQVPAAYSDAQDPDGNPNPLLKSHIDYPNARPKLNRDTRRFPGTGGGSLPTPGDVNQVLGISDFFTFSDQAEGLHDQVHGWTGGNGGDMAVVNVAAFDPIFWAHHTMIDRLWWQWQQQYGPATGITTEMLNAVLDPFPQKVSDVLYVEAL